MTPHDSSQAQGFGRQTDCRHAVVLSDFEDQAKQGRVNMKMFMNVDMVERESGRLKSFELGLDFMLKLLLHAAREKKLKPGSYHVSRQTTCFIHEIRQVLMA